MHLVYHPRKRHNLGEIIHFAYEEVPQVSETYAYTADEIYKPQLYSAFLNGINEHGVALSSNFFWSKENELSSNKGLLYGDIGQLIMERSRTAREATDVLARCVETYGFRGFSLSWPYLTFLIADPKEGWIIEVTPRHWVAKRCGENETIFYANELQIETKWGAAQSNFIEYAAEQGWYAPSSGKPFSFKDAYGTRIGEMQNRLRQSRMKELLKPKLGSITVRDLMSIHRDHYEGTENYYLPHTAPLPIYPICAPWTHACEIYHLRGDVPRVMGSMMWVCAASPCCSVFTPIYAGNIGDYPTEWMTGCDCPDSASAWWTFKKIQCLVAGYDASARSVKARSHIRDKWNLVEKRLFKKAARLEETAMKLWQSGNAKQACRLLTKFTNKELHSNFLKARQLLDRSIKLHSKKKPFSSDVCG